MRGGGRSRRGVRGDGAEEPLPHVWHRPWPRQGRAGKDRQPRDQGCTQAEPEELSGPRHRSPPETGWNECPRLRTGPSPEGSAPTGPTCPGASSQREARSLHSSPKSKRPVFFQRKHLLADG